MSIGNWGTNPFEIERKKERLEGISVSILNGMLSSPHVGVYKHERQMVEDAIKIAKCLIEQVDSFGEEQLAP